jgi:dGTPase
LTSEVLEGQRRRAEKSDLSTGAASPLLEVQIVDAADSIAYDAHDADDALEIGVLRLEQLLEIPLWRETHERVERLFGNLNDRQLRRAIVHEVIDHEVSDVLESTQFGIADYKISNVDDVRRAPVLVRASSDLAKKKAELERFLFEAVYHHRDVLGKRQQAQAALRESFEVLTNDPSLLSAKFRWIAELEGTPRAVGDYLGGMTDHFAIAEHRRLTAG